MPFVDGGSRNEAQLTAFFENNIKRPIEAADLRDRYEVFRSGQSFDINAEIIRDLCRADIVIADLSGLDPNPNVMYELGVRLNGITVDPNGPSLFTAVKEQLGLKLESTKAPVDVLVIDHVDRPIMAHHRVQS